MAASEDGGFALASSLEEVALRRRLLFRLLRDFDFARPEIHGELISEPRQPDRIAPPRGRRDWKPAL